MGRFDKLAKLFGITEEVAEKLSPEVINTLEKVNTPEISTSLKGVDREKYLQALDQAYGSRDVRAKNMGFGDKTWYHGTGNDFDQFSDDFLGSVNGKGDTKEQHWMSSNPEVAEVFANQAALKQYENEVYKPKYKDFSKRAKEFDSTLKTDAFNNTILGFLNTEKSHLDTFLKFGDITPEQYDAILKFKNEENELRSLSKYRSEKGRGSIIPLKVKEDGLRTIDVNGGYWYDNRDKIGNDEILVKNIKEGTDDIDIPIGDSLAIKDPSKVRSVNAAFDPRFKDSAKLLAGVGAMPAVSIDPIQSLSNFSEDVATPLVSRWEKLKSYLTEPLSKQLDLTKDKSESKNLKQALDLGLDPTNLIGGGVGAGISALQVLGSNDEEEE